MADTQNLLPTYELLLHAVTDTRFGVRDRWFIAGDHHDRQAAHLAFQELCQEFPGHLVTLQLVASTHDPTTGLFRDVVLETRGMTPLNDPKRPERPVRRDPPSIAKAATRQRLPTQRPAVVQPGSRLGLWLTAAGGVLAAVVLLVLLGG